MRKFSLVKQVDLDKINVNKLKVLRPERQVGAIRTWIDQNIKKYGSEGTQNTDEEMQTFIEAAAKHFNLYVGNPSFQSALEEQKGWGTGKVTEGRLGKVTDDLWEALPVELQKKLGTVLSSSAPPQGGQGIKQLSGTPKFKGTSYTYELKFLGAFGNHRCYGNKVEGGSKIEFSVYDPKGTLH